MSFLLIYPAVAALTLFIIVVIMVMLRFGATCCKLRHTAFANQEDWLEEEAYEQKVSYA
ncbi:uncharacterized protein LOC126978868 [Leptidea sinapis]|uniref:uncharacterized protein LOC126978868 n=1 Tax=Leptidea sinapis TaxID=189913 RepID=UPI0021C2958F|nr:uncharacterized protein LOC126978868 [Leptidea sinapis]